MTHEPDVSTSDVPVSELESTQPVAADPGEAAAMVNPSTDIATIRDLVLRAHPDVVPEMVTGETVDDLLASIEPAEAAWRRVSESVRSTTTHTPPASATVPAGGARPMPIDPDRLPASEKIRRGLANR